MKVKKKSRTVVKYFQFLKHYGAPFLFIHNRQFSTAVAIAPFEIYGWKLTGYLVFAVCSFSSCYQNFPKANGFHVYRKLIMWLTICKRPISLIFPANQEEVMSSSMEKQTVALSGSAGNQWNEMDWKTQTNEFYIIKGRQKFAGKRFSLSGVSNQLNKDYFTGQFMVFLKVITKPALKDRPLFSPRASTPFGGYRKNACWIWDDYSHLISRQLISTQPHIHTHIIHPANLYPLVEQLLKRCEN